MTFLANLTGLELRVTASEEEGLTDITTFSNGSKVISSGISLQTLHDLQFMMKFSIKYIVVDDFFPEIDSGSGLDNSTISYQLITGNADIAIGLLYNVLYRLRYGVPLMTFGSDPFYAHFQQPKNLIEQHNVFQKPFKPDLAIAIAMILSAVGILVEFSILIKSAASNITNNFPSFNTFIIKTLNGIGWAFATITQQDYKIHNSKRLPHTPIKLMMCCGMILSVGLYSYYSAAILSYFTMDAEIIQTFSQLIESGFTFYAISSVYASLPTQALDGATFKHLNIDYNESVDLLFKGNHAHLDTTDLFFIGAVQHRKSRQETCEVSKVKINGGIIRSGFYCTANFQHKEVFGLGILKIYQSGLTLRYFNNYLRRVVITCPKIRQQYHDHLGLKELWTLYVFYFYSVAIAIVVFAMETIHKKKCSCNRTPYLYRYKNK